MFSMLPRPRCLGPALVAAQLVACDPPPPQIQGDTPEPTDALRPESDRGRVPEDARITDYVIDARLDAETHTITGTARITWRNKTHRTVRKLPLHLYMNAFRAEDTTWMREARGRHRGQEQTEKGAWGYTDITQVKLLSTVPIAALDRPEAKAEEPRTLIWAEDEDPTTMQVELQQPVAPGESAVVELDFVTKLPQVFARTGFADDFHMVGQWYPKLGVLDADRGWQAHVFTLNSEFFADFGDYEVTLDVPESMIVGATGIRIAEEAADEGRKRLRYAASMVHDFAWAADPDFVEVRSSWNGVRIRQLIRAEDIDDAAAHEEALAATMESMEARFGAYPWSTVTVIHPPPDAGGAKGMEYPTLFTTSSIVEESAWWRIIGLEEQVSGVFTTVHEFGHQYFQGLLASDEFREPWLDGGMNTTSNSLALADWQGENSWILRVGAQELRTADLTYLSMRLRSDLDPVRRPADSFLAVTKSYGTTVYRKTAATMLTLRNLVGHADFDRALHLYADTWRFRHPSGDDLLGLLVRELGPSVLLPSEGEAAAARLRVDDFLKQAMETTLPVDFALLEVRNRRMIGDAGWHRDENGILVGGEEEGPQEQVRQNSLRELDDDEVEGVVVVQRKGELRMPIQLRVDFEDGGSQRLWWDGEDRYHVFAWPARRVRRAEIDPDKLNLLETDRLNNLRYVEAADADDGLSAPIGDAVEITSLALMGGMGL